MTARGLSSPMRSHRLAEQLAVLGLVDRLGARADHLDTELFQHARALERQRGVERRLAAHRRQEHELVVGARLALSLDDLRHDAGRDRLDVGRVRELGVGHDRRGIGVDQHDAIALGLERLAGLRSRIIELAGLTYDDRSRADDEDGLDIRAFGHEPAFYCRSAALAIGRTRSSRAQSPRAGKTAAESGAQRKYARCAVALYCLVGIGESILMSTG